MHLNGERLEVAAAILVLAAGGYAIGWIIAILTRQNKEATVSMIYGSGMRNISAGAVIAGAYFSGGNIISGYDRNVISADPGGFLRKYDAPGPDRTAGKGEGAWSFSMN